MSEAIAKELFTTMLPMLRAMTHMYQYMHWRSSGPNYYGDHQLYERLYDDVEDQIDGVAEKIIGLFGDDAIGPVSDAEITYGMVDQFMGESDSPDEFPEIAIEVEKMFLELVKQLMKALENVDFPSDGLENMAQDLADQHEEFIYLLKQREKTASPLLQITKVAEALDQKGLFEEASFLDDVLVTLAKKKKKKGGKKGKPKPTSPDKWSKAKAKAKKKFRVYPSAYANAWAAKEYKRMGGGWRSS